MNDFKFYDVRLIVSFGASTTVTARDEDEVERLVVREMISRYGADVEIEILDIENLGEAYDE